MHRFYYFLMIMTQLLFIWLNLAPSHKDLKKVAPFGDINARNVLF